MTELSKDKETELDEEVKSSLFEEDDDMESINAKPELDEEDPDVIAADVSNKLHEKKKEEQLPQNININLGNMEKRRGPGRPPKTELRDDGPPSGDEELLDNFDNLGDGFFLEIHRVEPKYYDGVMCEGFMERTTDSVDFDYLRNKFGGGKYDIIKRGPKRWDKGRPIGIRAHGRKRIVVSGDPVIIKKKGAAPEERDPDLSEKALNYGQKVMDKMADEKDAERRRADDMTKMLLTGAMGKNDNKEVVELMKATMDAQMKSLQMQLEASRADAKTARQEQLDERKQFSTQLQEIRKDMDKKSESSMNPMLEIFKQQIQSNKDESKSQLTMMMELSKQNISMINNNNENNLKMLTETNKVQTEVLKNELQRLSTELNQTRVNKGDLVSELKKFKMVKELFASEGSDDDKGTVVDKILDRLPDLAEALPGLAGLFSKGTPRLVSKNAPAQLPQPMPQIEEPQREQPAQQEQPAEGINMQDQVKIATQLKAFIESTEDAIEDGMDPEKFASDSVIGKYDNEILKQIASADVAALIQFLSDKVDTESPLATVKGKDFLRKLHKAMQKIA